MPPNERVWFIGPFQLIPECIGERQLLHFDSYFMYSILENYAKRIPIITSNGKSVFKGCQ